MNKENYEQIINALRTSAQGVPSIEVIMHELDRIVYTKIINDGLPMSKYYDIMADLIDTESFDTVSADDIKKAIESRKQTDKEFKAKKHKNKTPYPTLYSKARTLWLTVYDEQLVYGWGYTCKQIQKMNTKPMTEDDKVTGDALGVCHDCDVHGEFFIYESDKKHYHIAFRANPLYTTPRVSQVMDYLGIMFRPGVDSGILEKGAVQGCRNFATCALYLTHDDPASIAQNKYPYSIDAIVSNHTKAEVEQIRQGYARPNENIRATTKEWHILEEKAMELGKSGGNYEDFLDHLDIVFTSNTAKMKVVRRRYDRALESEVNKNINVSRTCIYIQGIGNTGKSYGAIYALNRMGIQNNEILDISGQGTGRFDSLTINHRALIVDDDILPNALYNTDDKKRKAYRRGSGNPYWCGDIVIVLSNTPFEDWARKCGYSNPEHIEALKTRFFICKVMDAHGTPMLVCDEPASRGNVEYWDNKVEKFEEFQEYMDESMGTYQQIKKTRTDHAFNEHYYAVVRDWNLEQEKQQQIFVNGTRVRGAAIEFYILCGEDKTEWVQRFYKKNPEYENMLPDYMAEFIEESYKGITADEEEMFA